MTTNIKLLLRVHLIYTGILLASAALANAGDVTLVQIGPQYVDPALAPSETANITVVASTHEYRISLYASDLSNRYPLEFSEKITGASKLPANSRFRKISDVEAELIITVPESDVLPAGSRNYSNVEIEVRNAVGITDAAILNLTAIIDAANPNTMDPRIVSFKIANPLQPLTQMVAQSGPGGSATLAIRGTLFDNPVTIEIRGALDTGLNGPLTMTEVTGLLPSDSAQLNQISGTQTNLIWSTPYPEGTYTLAIKAADPQGHFDTAFLKLVVTVSDRIDMLDANGEELAEWTPLMRGKDKLFVRVIDPDLAMRAVSLSSGNVKLTAGAQVLGFALNEFPLASGIYTNWPSAGIEFTTPGLDPAGTEVAAVTGERLTLEYYDYDSLALGDTTNYLTSNIIYVNNTSSALNVSNSLRRTLGPNAARPGDIIKFMPDLDLSTSDVFDRIINLGTNTTYVAGRGIIIDGSDFMLDPQPIEIHHDGAGSFVILADAVIKGVKFVHDSVSGGTNVLIYDSIYANGGGLPSTCGTAPNSLPAVVTLGGTNANEAVVVEGADMGILIRTVLTGSRVRILNSHVLGTRTHGIAAFDIGNNGVYPAGEYALQVSGTVVENGQGTGIELFNSSNVLIDQASQVTGNSKEGVHLSSRKVAAWNCQDGVPADYATAFCPGAGGECGGGDFDPDPTYCDANNLPDWMCGGRDCIPAPPDCVPMTQSGYAVIPKTTKITLKNSRVSANKWGFSFSIPENLLATASDPRPEFSDIAIGIPGSGNTIANNVGAGDGGAIDSRALVTPGLPEGTVIHDQITWKENIYYGNSAGILTPSDVPPVAAVTSTQYDAGTGKIIISGTGQTGDELQLYVSSPGENQGRFFIPTMPTTELTWNGTTFTFSITRLKIQSLVGADPLSAPYAYTVVKTTNQAGNIHSSAFSLPATVTAGTGALDHFSVEPSLGTQTAGTAFNVTIVAKDSSNNTITAYSPAG
ncbi:MAG: right-handed parallel beta-helix repeat-containing protein, partial [Candidatus Omnitrophica bacterium]|nr:right-handed parallel beta-helix repeat-containing protein [Candidatus Omnitrophota bacterium]